MDTNSISFKWTVLACPLNGSAVAQGSKDPRAEPQVFGAPGSEGGGGVNETGAVRAEAEERRLRSKARTSGVQQEDEIDPPAQGDGNIGEVDRDQLSGESLGNSTDTTPKSQNATQNVSIRQDRARDDVSGYQGDEGATLSRDDGSLRSARLRSEGIGVPLTGETSWTNRTQVGDNSGSAESDIHGGSAADTGRNVEEGSKPWEAEEFSDRTNPAIPPEVCYQQACFYYFHLVDGECSDNYKQFHANVEMTCNDFDVIDRVTDSNHYQNTLIELAGQDVQEIAVVLQQDLLLHGGHWNVTEVSGAHDRDGCFWNVTASILLPREDENIPDLDLDLLNLTHRALLLHAHRENKTQKPFRVCGKTTTPRGFFRREQQLFKDMPCLLDLSPTPAYSGFALSRLAFVLWFPVIVTALFSDWPCTKMFG